MFTRLSNPISFPFYLIPSTPFRRQSVTNGQQIDEPSTRRSVSTVHESYLRGCASYLRCAKCAVDICLTSQIISKGFTGRHGRAFLVAPSSSNHVSSTRSALGLPNTKTDNPSQRQLVTGIHTVSDVRCSFCGSMLGWKYDGAEEESQRYKVGKYILETKMVCSSNVWEREDVEPAHTKTQSRSLTLGRKPEQNDVQFDSEDDEECEDLFAGVWSPALAVKRRQAKSFRRVVLDMESRVSVPGE